MRGAGVLGCIAGVCVGAEAWAGAWPMEQGRVQAIASIYIDAADRAFDDNGDVTLDADFEKLESSTFIEWGATPRLTLIAQPVVQHVTMRSPQGDIEEATGFASSQVAARWLVGRPLGGVFSVQGAVVAPGTTENVISARLGDGGLATELRALAGRGWGGEHRGAFLDTQLAYRWQYDGFPDEVRLDATFGVRPSSDWMLLAQSFSTWREAELAKLMPQTQTHKAQLSLVRRLNDRWSYQVGGYGAYAGRNVVEERAVFGSLWMRFSP